MTERPQDGQTKALRVFLRLIARGPDWAGKLVLQRGLGSNGRAMSIAANIAGAGCLTVEPDGAECRLAIKAGACDFLVNTTDEALRILKNELRRRRPVSVALQAAEDPALGELAERGVAPNLYVGEAGGAQESEMADTEVGEYLQKLGLELRWVGCANTQDLQQLDRRLLELIPADDPRRRWTTRAPAFFHRERSFGRAVCLNPEEFAALGPLAAP